MELKLLSRQDIAEKYNFPKGKQDEIDSCWLMLPLHSQLKTFKNGLGRITYFKTKKRDLLETPYVPELESPENQKEVMYEMISDYILITDNVHNYDCDCGECNEDTRASLLKLDGYDDCYLGVAESYGELPALVYDKYKILENLQSDGMSYEEAQEFFDFNILGSYFGEKMPIFLDRIPLDDLG